MVVAQHRSVLQCSALLTQLPEAQALFPQQSGLLPEEKGDHPQAQHQTPAIAQQGLFHAQALSLGTRGGTNLVNGLQNAD